MIAVAKRKKENTGFGRRLRALREAAGLTLIELGERAEMPYQNVARLEREEREPTWPTVLKLADALGVEPNAFRGDGAEGDAEAEPKRVAPRPVAPAAKPDRKRAPKKE